MSAKEFDIISLDVRALSMKIFIAGKIVGKMRIREINPINTVNNKIRFS
jgi:hypothetical protein